MNGQPAQEGRQAEGRREPEAVALMLAALLAQPFRKPPGGDPFIRRRGARRFGSLKRKSQEFHNSESQRRLLENIKRHYELSYEKKPVEVEKIVSQYRPYGSIEIDWMALSGNYVAMLALMELALEDEDEWVLLVTCG